MAQEKFMNLTGGEQAVSVVFGGLLVGANLADVLVGSLNQSKCETLPGNYQMAPQCPASVKAIELGGGSALIITASFAVAAAISGVKNLTSRRS